jgi:hypothetical protein
MEGDAHHRQLALWLVVVLICHAIALSYLSNFSSQFKKSVVVIQPAFKNTVALSLRLSHPAASAVANAPEAIASSAVDSSLVPTAAATPDVSSVAQEALATHPTNINIKTNINININSHHAKASNSRNNSNNRNSSNDSNKLNDAPINQTNEAHIGKKDAVASKIKATPLKMPKSTTLMYQVQGQRKGVLWNADGGVLKWDSQGETYVLELISPHHSGKARTQTSMGQLVSEVGLQPTRFGDRLKTEQATHFQRDDTVELIRFSANVPSVALQTNAQDQLSILIQLAALVSGRVDAGLPMTTEFEMQVATSREAAIWHFESSLMEDTHLVYIKKKPSHPYDGLWELWLSQRLNYLPSRWRVTLHNGDFYEYQLTAP